MADQKALVWVKQADAKNFMEGVEHCREYVRDTTLWFGTSIVPPGQRGEVDPGHGVYEEVFFCAAGHVLIYDGDCYYELEVSDALLIPQGYPTRSSTLAMNPPPLCGRVRPVSNHAGLLLIGVDLGTTALKCAAYSEDGTLVASTTREYGQRLPVRAIYTGQLVHRPSRNLGCPPSPSANSVDAL
jgi:hypothetical protein